MSEKRFKCKIRAGIKGSAPTEVGLECRIDERPYRS